MTKGLKKILSVMTSITMLMSIFVVGSIVASADTFDELTYEINDNQVTITNCDESASGELVIPSQIDGCIVTTIAENAFKDCMGITKLVVPDSVTYIATGALTNMVGLEELQIPFVGISRDATAFEKVFGVIFGYDTKYDSSGGSQNESTEFRFESVGSLNTATWQYTCLNKQKQYVSSGTGQLYYLYHKQSYYYYIPSSLTNVTVTDDTIVSTASFLNCDCLEKITINNDISSIENYAFYNCKSLISFCNSDNLQSIGNYAFQNCLALKAIELPESLKTIGKYAFKNCSSIVSLTIPERLDSIGRGALNGMTSLENLSLPFTGLSRNAENYNSVFGVIFDYTTFVDIDNWKYIERSDYAYVPQIAGEIEDAVCQFSDYSQRAGNRQAYSTNGPVYDYGLTSYWYYIPESLKNISLTNSSSINIAAFKNCSNLVSLDVKKKINSVGRDAFYGCNGIMVYGKPDSDLESYCNTNNIIFNSHDTIVDISVTIIDSIPQYLGQPINSDGIQVNGICYDGSVVPISNGYNITGTLSKTNSNSIIVSYEGFEKNVNIDAVAIKSISVKQHFNKREYSEKERINPKGLVLNILYVDGETKSANSGYTIDEYEVKKLVDDEKVSINYLGFITYEDITITHQFAFCYNDDATTEKDGTETEICSICGKTGITRTKIGSKINPTENANINVAKATTVDYGTKVTIKATAVNLDPAYHLVLCINGNEYEGSNKEVSYEYGEIKDDINYSVKIVDKKGVIQKDNNGKDLKKDGGKITCNDGFFQKLIAFFRGLFNALSERIVKP